MSPQENARPTGQKENVPPPLRTFQDEANVRKPKQRKFGAKKAGRHQYQFPAVTEQELADVQVAMAAHSESEAVRDCIALTAWILRLHQEGAKVAIVRPNGQVEAIQLFSLRHVLPVIEGPATLRSSKR